MRILYKFDISVKCEVCLDFSHIFGRIEGSVLFSLRTLDDYKWRNKHEFSKKIMSQQKSEDKGASKATAAKGTKKVSTGVTGDLKTIILCGIFGVILLVLCIGVGVQQLKPKTVLKVNDTKYTLDDLMYPIYERESQYILYDEMYQMYMGTSVWDTSYMGSDRSVEASATNSMGLKQEIINSEVAYDVLSQEAKKAGYSLEDADKKKVEENVENALKGLSWGQKLQLNMTKGNLTTRFEERVLADKYKADKEKELFATVDKAAVKGEIKEADYKEYKVQYYAVATTKADEEGNTKDLTKKEKKEMLEKLQKVADEAKDAKDFTSLIGEEETDIQYAEETFLDKDGWNMVTTKKILNEIKAMKNDEISKIYEDEKSGYYIFVKMIENDCKDSYNDAVDAAVQEAEYAAYDGWYAEVLKNYKVETVADVWDTVEIGTVTTSIVTLEDLQAMAEEDSSEATSE